MTYSQMSPRGGTSDTSRPGPESPWIGEPKATYRFDYSGWQVAVQLNGTSVDGSIRGHSDLRVDDRPMCHLTLAPGHRSGADAVQTLSAKARCYVDDWFARSRAGQADDPEDGTLS